MTATSPNTSNFSSERLGWVDAARGIAILLVVFGHMWRGVEAAGLIGEAALFARVDRFIYLFHMPVFFLLSGLFLPSLFNKTSALRVIGKQALRLVYPLVLWTNVFLFARYFAGAAANAPISASEILIFPLPPVDHMWFLWALFCIQVPLIAFLFAAPMWRKRWELPLAVFALSVLLLGVMPLPGALYAWFYNAFEYAPFVAMGWLAATHRPLATPSMLEGAIALAVFVALGLLVPTQKASPLVELGLTMVMSGAFLVIVMIAHDRFERSSLAKLARTLGVVSLTIFLTHTLFSATVRATLLSADIQALSIHILLGTAFGLLCPYLLNRAARRLHMAKLLGF